MEKENDIRRVIGELTKTIIAFKKGDIHTRLDIQFEDRDLSLLIEEINLLGKALQQKQWDASLNEEKMNQLFDVITAISSLDFSKKYRISDEQDLYDGIGFGLNILGDELRETTVSRNFLDHIFHSIKDIILVVNLNDEVEIANQAFLTNLEYSRDEVVGQPLDQFILDFKTAKDCPAKEKIAEFIRRDGTHLPVELLVFPMEDSKGGNSGYIFSARDIQEKLQREAELKKLNEELERRVKEEVKKSREKDQIMIEQSRLAAIGEMIGHIAHQWRQPLNALSLLTGKLKLDYELGSLDEVMFREFSERSQLLIEKMSSTIDDFRNYFRPARDPEVFEISSVIQKSLSLLEPALNHNKIKIDFQADEKVYLYGFPNEYSQVFLNLLSNALDALESKKSDDSRIEIHIYKNEANGVLSITDNGGGIPEDVLPLIFDPYFSTKKEKNGTGIGLYMSTTIIHDHMNGKIIARNVADGAKFEVVVPFLDVEEQIQPRTEKINL